MDQRLTVSAGVFFEETSSRLKTPIYSLPKFLYLLTVLYERRGFFPILVRILWCGERDIH